MNKISLTIDVSKIRKERFNVRNYKTNQGQEVSIKEMKLEVIPLKEEKILKSTDTYDLVKVGFVAEPLTKEEQDKKEKSNIIGDALQFRNKEDNVPKFDVDSRGRNLASEGEVSLEDLPF
jgi:hypothetical protein